MNRKIKILLALFLVIFVLSTNIYAFTLDSIFSDTNTKFGYSNGTEMDPIITVFTSDIMPIIRTVGYLIFAIVTVGLGIKYMFSSIEGKSSVKETLPTFIVGAVFFYFAETIVNKINSARSDLTTSYTSLSAKVLGTVNEVVQIGAFAIIIFIGIKYMFESPSGKASIKERMVPLIIGMAFVFSASGILGIILDAAKTAIG